MERDSVEQRIRSLRESVREHNDRLRDVEKSLTELVRKLDPVLTDYAYAKRRREDDEKSSASRSVFVLKLVGLLIAAVPVVVEAWLKLAGH